MREFFNRITRGGIERDLSLGGLLIVSAALNAFYLAGRLSKESIKAGLALDVPLLAAGICAAIAILIIASRLLRPAIGVDRIGRGLAISIVAFFAIQIFAFLAWNHPVEKSAIVQATPMLTGYGFKAGKIEDLGDFIARYPDYIQHLGYHGRTHPPGFFLISYAFGKLFPGSDCGTLRAAPSIFNPDKWRYDPKDPFFCSYPISSAFYSFCLICTLAITLRIAWKSGLESEALGFSIPMLALSPPWLIFGGYPESLLALLGACATMCAVQGSSGKKKYEWLEFAAGLLVGFGALCSYALMPIALLLVAFFFLNSLASGLPDRRRFIRKVLMFCVGAILPLALLALIWGYRPLDSFIANMSVHKTIKAEFRGASPGLDILDYFADLGFPVIVLAIVGTIGSLRNRFLRNILIAAWITLGCLAIFNSSIGEGSRLWAYLTPLVLLAAGAGLMQFEKRTRTAVLLSVLIYLASQSIVFIVHWPFRLPL